MKSDERRLVGRTDHSTIDQVPHIAEFLVVATESEKESFVEHTLLSTGNLPLFAFIILKPVTTPGLYIT